MHGDRTMRLIRVIPTAVLVATAPAAVFGGFVLIFLGLGFAPTNGPGRQTMPAAVVLGVVVLLVGPALVWLARGVWRARLWPTHIALVFSVAVIAYLAWVAPGAYTPLGSSRNPTTGRLEPNYNTGAELLVLAIIPYAVVLACLVVAELRQQRRHAQDEV